VHRGKHFLRFRRFHPIGFDWLSSYLPNRLVCLRSTDNFLVLADMAADATNHYCRLVLSLWAVQNRGCRILAGETRDAQLTPVLAGCALGSDTRYRGVALTVRRYITTRWT